MRHAHLALTGPLVALGPSESHLLHVVDRCRDLWQYIACGFS
jgi:hypothetical protein